MNNTVELAGDRMLLFVLFLGELDSHNAAVILREI